MSSDWAVAELTSHHKMREGAQRLNLFEFKNYISNVGGGGGVLGPTLPMVNKAIETSSQVLLVIALNNEVMR